MSISGLAAVLADPSRAAMLEILLDGSALPIGRLARRVGVTAATASSHLRRLVDARLVQIDVVGRERRVRIAGPDVAELLERIAVLASDGRTHSTELDRLRFARTCYDHVAGLLGVALAERLCAIGWLYQTSDNFEPAPALLDWLARHGHPVSGDPRRPLSRACIDWTERVPHVAGRTGAAIATLLLEAGWVVRTRESRALRLTGRGSSALERELGLRLALRSTRA